MRSWVVRGACHAAAAAALAFLLVFHIVLLRVDSAAPAAGATAAAPPAAASSAAASVAAAAAAAAAAPPPLAPSIRLVTDARPNTTLAPLDHPYTYVAMTLRVRNLPGGGYSDVLDAHVQDVIRKFWRDAAKPLAAVALVHAEQQGSVTATADATYYVAAIRSALQTMTAFNEYGGHATQVGSTAPPTVAATPTPAAGAPSPTPAVTTTPPPSPSAAPSSASPPPARFVAAVRQSNWNVEGGSAFGAELRKRPQMAATEAWLLAPLSNKVHVGEVGATVADGVVTPLPSDDKRAHPPILAISLAVGLSLLTAVVVLVGALIVRRRKAER